MCCDFGPLARNVNRPNRTGGSKGSAYRLVAADRIRDDQPMGEGTIHGGSATEDDGFDDNVVDEITGLPNRRGFLEVLRMEERRHARYAGTPTLFLVGRRRRTVQA